MGCHYKRDGLYPGLMDSLKGATPENMPAELRDAYLESSPYPEKLSVFVAKCAERMLRFSDWRSEDIQSITAPTMIVIGDADIVRPEHAIEVYRLLPHGELAILPDTDHMAIINRTGLLLDIIPPFLDAPMPLQ